MTDHDWEPYRRMLRSVPELTPAVEAMKADDPEAPGDYIGYSETLKMFLIFLMHEPSSDVRDALLRKCFHYLDELLAEGSGLSDVAEDVLRGISGYRPARATVEELAAPSIQERVTYDGHPAFKRRTKHEEWNDIQDVGDVWDVQQIVADLLRANSTTP